MSRLRLHLSRLKNALVFFENETIFNGNRLQGKDLRRLILRTKVRRCNFSKWNDISLQQPLSATYEPFRFMTVSGTIPASLILI